MQKFDGYVLCSDIDGTLITDSHVIPERNLEAIRYFRQQGGKFTFATGRIHSSVEQFIPVLQPDLPAIVSNGCGIYDFNRMEYLWLATLEQDAAELAEKIMAEHPESSCAIVNKKGTFFLRENEEAYNLCKVENFPLRMGTYETIEKPWVKFLFCQEPEATSALQAEYAESPYHQKYKILQSGATYFEYFHVCASKGKTLQRLAELAGFSMDKTIAIGDNENDEEMLRVAKIGAAVQNAYPAAKNAADIITVSNNEGGVADLIEKLDEML